MSILKWLALRPWLGRDVIVTDTLDNSPGGALLSVSMLGLTIEPVPGDEEWFPWRSVVSVQVGTHTASVIERKNQRVKEHIERVEPRLHGVLSPEEIQELLAKDDQP